MRSKRQLVAADGNGFGLFLPLLELVVLTTSRPDNATEVRPVQEWLGGEADVRKMHIAAAASFVVLIGFISIFFGFRERCRRQKHSAEGRFWWGHWVCTGVIWLGGVWILLTRDFLFGGPRWSVFAGEVVAFLAFGISWLTKGAERKLLFGGWEPIDNAPASGSD